MPTNLKLDGNIQAPYITTDGTNLITVPATTGTIATPSNTGSAGQVLTSNGAGVAPSYQNAGGSTGTVLQTISTALDTTFTTSISNASGFVDVTGLSVSITPASTSNKVLVSGTISLSGSNNLMFAFRIVRGSTAVGVGAAAGDRTQITCGTYTLDGGVYGDQIITIPFQFLDSPSTTSSTTYKIQVSQTTSGSSYSVYINRTAADSNSSSYDRAISVITTQEIKG